MDINSSSGTQIAYLEDTDSGEGLSIFFSQGPDAQARYRFKVKARVDEGMYDMGEFYVSPPGASTPINGLLSRMVGGAVCPGATNWSVEVSAIPDDEGIPEGEESRIILSSSRCCTAPIGVSRVSERYMYAAGANVGTLANFIVLAGMKVTGIAALGLTGGGTVVINGGPTIQVPDGISVNLEPKSSIQPNAAIELNNVDYVIEYLESA